MCYGVKLSYYFNQYCGFSPFSDVKPCYRVSFFYSVFLCYVFLPFMMLYSVSPCSGVSLCLGVVVLACVKVLARVMV